MIDASFEHTSHHSREKRFVPPQLLPTDEVIKKAQLDFSNKSELESSQIEQFVKNHVRVVRVGNVDVTIVDQEHKEHKGQIDPILQAYLDSPFTKTAVVEYFLPELQRNAPKLSEFIQQLVGSVDDLAKEGSVGSMFMDIAEVMKKNGRTVSCVDIANKLSYEVYYALMKVQALPMFTSLIPQMPLSPVDRLLLASVLPLVSWGADSLLEASGKGIYDKQKISKLENLALSMEDGRRIYAAKGLKSLAQDYNKEYPVSNLDQGNPQIVVVYPRAHALRIADYMTSDLLVTKAAKTAKQFLYYLPNLDYSYRTYTWKDMLAKATNKPELASWQLTTSKKVSPFK